MSLILQLTVRRPDNRLADYHYGIVEDDQVRQVVVTPAVNDTILAVASLSDKLAGKFLGGKLESISLELFNQDGPRAWAARGGVFVPWKSRR